MSKKSLYLIIGVIVIIIVSLVLFILSKPQKLAETPVIPQTQAQISDIMRQAINTQNASLCGQIKKEEDKKSCLINVIITEAGIKQDPKICGQIEEENLKIVCTDNLIVTRAMNARNSDICKEMTDKTRIEQCKKDVRSL